MTARLDPFATAIDVLDERGWQQGNPYANGGPLCLVQAVGEACYRLAFGTEEFEELDFASLELLRVRFGEVSGAVRFNDADGTSEEDVKLELKRLSEAWVAS